MIEIFRILRNIFLGQKVLDFVLGLGKAVWKEFLNIMLMTLRVFIMYMGKLIFFYRKSLPQKPFDLGKPFDDSDCPRFLNTLVRLINVPRTCQSEFITLFRYLLVNVKDIVWQQSVTLAKEQSQMFGLTSAKRRDKYISLKNNPSWQINSPFVFFD